LDGKFITTDYKRGLLKTVDGLNFLLLSYLESFMKIINTCFLSLFFICTVFLEAKPTSDDLLKNNMPSLESSQLDSRNTIFFTTTRNKTTGALRQDFLEKLKTIFSVDVFVESGTYLGGTTQDARPFFSKIHSVELSKDFFKKAKKRFRNEQKISLYQGDSGTVFYSILPQITSKILFYLDGHYSGGTTALGAKVSPLLEELKAIKDAQKTDSVIIIDDIRLMQDSKFPEKIRNTSADGYPHLPELIQALLEINPEYQFCFTADALLVFPKQADVKVSPILASCSLHRISQAFSGVPEDLLSQADKIISVAQGAEREELLHYYHTYSPFELENGFRSYGTFWLSLLYFGQNEPIPGQQFLRKAVENSGPNWRATTLSNKL